MHFSTATIIAAAAVFTSTFAAPTTSDSGDARLSAVVSHLDANGHLEWTSTPDGGRMTTIPQDKVDLANKNLKGASKRSDTVLARRGTGSAVGSYTNAGQIADFAASYACESSGDWAISGTVNTLATTACSNFLKTLPGAPIAESAWNVYQGALSADADGGQESTIYRWFYNTASAPALTQSICTQAYNSLTSSFCQGKSDHGADTQGGQMKIGSGDDVLVVGFDPNSA